MRPYAEVIGDPIAHSKSPLIHKHWLDVSGIVADYRRVRVAPGELAAYFAARRADPAWRGCNVTIPHKLAAMSLVDRVSPIARQVGAVNVVVPQGAGLAGDNTDVGGFAGPLGARRFDHAIVIGAGGAARAVLVALKARVKRVTLLNRDVARARKLIDEFGLAGKALPLGADPGVADLLVNASPLGMAGQSLPPPLVDHIRDDGLVYDLVYAPLETALLAAARDRGLEIIDGLAMLIGQAGDAFAAFFGRQPPRDDDRELRALLTA